jgi:hypothetical protein
MAGATRRPETTVANAKWSLCWSLRERASNRSGWNGRECVPIHNCSWHLAAGKVPRRLGPLARVWREASYREIPTIEFSASTLTNTQALRNVCRRCAICDFRNNGRLVLPT